MRLNFLFFRCGRTRCIDGQEDVPEPLPVAARAVVFSLAARPGGVSGLF